MASMSDACACAPAADTNSINAANPHFDIMESPFRLTARVAERIRIGRPRRRKYGATGATAYHPDDGRRGRIRSIHADVQSERSGRHHDPDRRVDTNLLLIDNPRLPVGEPRITRQLRSLRHVVE